AHTNTERPFAAHRNVFVRHPFDALAILVFEPGVGPDDIQVSVAVDVRHSLGGNGAVNWRADWMPDPGLSGVRRYGVPAERVKLRALVPHHGNIRFAVAIDVHNEDIVRSGSVFVENDPLEALLTRLAKIAVPNSAAHEIRPAITVHIQRCESDIGQVVCANQVPYPVVCPLVFEPIQLRRVEGPPSKHEIEISISIQIGQSRQTIVTQEFVDYRQTSVDEMRFELK